MRGLQMVSLAALVLAIVDPVTAQDAPISFHKERSEISPLPAHWIWDERVDATARRHRDARSRGSDKRRLQELQCFPIR